jgi:N-acetylglucosaminyl-diphospho-decaprenol L-rhamnosyltransferase
MAVVQIVVVSYNSKHVIADSLCDIVGHPDIRVTVVDNQSQDGTPEFIEREFPSVQVIRSGSNLGFAKAVNLGVAAGESPFLLLLNPDAIVDATVVLEMAARMEQNPSIGITAPHIVQPGGKLEILETGRFPTLWRVFTHYSGMSRLSSHVPILEGQFLLQRSTTRSRDVDWVTGAVMMIRRSVFDHLDGLSTRWFMYAEDIEICLRVKRAGFRVIYYSDIRATHLMGGSDQFSPAETNSAPFVNLLDFYERDLAPNRIAAAAWRLVVATGLATRSAAYGLKSHRGNNSERAYWRARSDKFSDYASAVLEAPRGH